MDGGVEILSYIGGESGPDGWARVVDEAGLQAAARLLRAYHDAIRGWAPDSPPRWYTGQAGTGGPGEVVCHGDFGPWNIVWRGPHPVGLLDWEYAHPAPPRGDVAYALEFAVPFRRDAECVRWLRYASPPDRRRRLELFAAAYGLRSTAGLVEEVIAVQRVGLECVRRLAADGHERQARAVQAGALETLRQRIRWSEAHRFLFE